MDAYLIDLAKKGSHEALAQLLYNNYEIVYKYLIKFTFDVNIAEDLAQDTMVKAIEKFELYNPDRSKFSTWLIAIAQNIYIDGLRKQKREKKYLEQDATSEQSELHLVVHDDSIGRVLDALAKLSEDSRLPLLLKHYYGFTVEEISKKMSIPEGTVKSRIHNALKFLRKELGSDD